MIAFVFYQQLRQYILNEIVNPIFLFFFTFVSCLVSPLFGDDVSSVWDYRSSVEQYSAPGGTAKSSVAAQVEHLRTWLKQQAQ